MPHDRSVLRAAPGSAACAAVQSRKEKGGGRAGGARMALRRHTWARACRVSSGAAAGAARVPRIGALAAARTAFIAFTQSRI
eukprot:6182689-Pleurochrysis_carterae.AAC.2